MTNWKRYILWFAHEYVEFRKAEFNSIVELFGLQYRGLSCTAKPFWVVEFSDDEAALKFASRSIALRGILELWAHESQLPAFHQQLRNYTHEYYKQVQEYFDIDCSFKITVETYNKHLSMKEKIERIEGFTYLPIKGTVDLKRPKVEWWYIEFWGLDPTTVPDVPDDVLFGRWLANGQRHLIKELSLKHRKFIGHTSMDAQLSLLMANQALVQDGDLVFDPFVGTGSLLVSAAKFGGYVIGADIDFMIVHARCRPSRITQKVRDEDESVYANLKQYGCAERYIDVLVSDFSNPLWRHNLQFDSIITDPPYGIREATEKVELKQPSKTTMRNPDMPHYPSTSHYALKQLFADLLNFAARHLKLDGRLVCWLPFHREDYSDKMIPEHPNLTLVANSEQTLAGQISRRLLTYRKTSAQYQEIAAPVVMENCPLGEEFRERYFNSGVESRHERRTRKSAQREQGRLEALKRGKDLINGKEQKCQLNKARFKC